MIESANAIDMDSPPLSDDLLLDSEGNFPSAQPQRAEPMEPSPMPDKLSLENFRLVKNLADKVRFLKIQQERSRRFLAHMERLRDQRQRAHWLGPVPTLPLLPGAAIFTQDVHIEWSALVNKFERKLLKLVITSLPSAIEGLEEKINA